MSPIQVSVAVKLLVIALVLPAITLGAENYLGSPAMPTVAPGAKKAAPGDYRQVVDDAFPRYENTVLTDRLTKIKRRYPRGRDTIKVWSLDAIERSLGLAPGTYAADATSYEGEERQYSVDRRNGRVYLYDGEGQPAFLSEREGKEVLDQVSKYHEKLLKRVGITDEEILFKDTSLMLMQGMTDPNTGAPQESETMVRSIQTYVLRAVDGIMVEGSSAKIGSRGSREVEMMDIKWPPFRYPPSLKSFELKSNTSLKDEITEDVKRLAEGREAQVRMAVVLRPVTMAGELFYVPSLKVGVQAGAEGDGAIFYKDLLIEKVAVDEGLTDEESGGAREQTPAEDNPMSGEAQP